MKKIFFFSFLFFLTIQFVLAQSTQAEIQKKADEAMKKAEQIMNDPKTKAAIEKAKQMSQQPTTNATGPVRTCIGCRQRLAQAKLARVVQSTHGPLLVSRTAPGRGAWLCNSMACLTLATQRKAFERALRVASGAVDVTGVRAVFEGTAPDVAD